MPILNANIRAFKSHGNTEITQFLFCNLDMYMYSILTRTVETNSVVFISLFDTCTLYSHSVSH